MAAIKNRLHLDYPDLASTLQGASSDQLRAMAFQSCRLAVQNTGLESPIIREALDALENGNLDNPSLRQRVEALVKELDDKYWNLQEAWEEGSADQEEYLLAFVKARAANAVYFALDGSPDVAAAEALYEAHAAIDDIEELKKIAGKALGKRIA